MIKRFVVQAVVRLFLESGRPPSKPYVLESDPEPESKANLDPKPEAQPALYSLWQPVKRRKVHAS